MKLLKFNKHMFLKESYSDFNQYDIGPSPIAGCGFAVDQALSVNSQDDSPFSNNYHKSAMMVNSLLNIIKQMNKDHVMNYGTVKFDQFLEDLDDITDFKILKININSKLRIDIYISFRLNDEDFFGVFNDFNWIQKGKLKSDLFSDNRYRYINYNYIIKIDNYFRKILLSWFKPHDNSEYISLKDINIKNELGKSIILPINSTISIISSNVMTEHSYIKLEYKGKIYTINGNNYYYFNYWFNLID